MTADAARPGEGDPRQIAYAARRRGVAEAAISFYRGQRDANVAAAAAAAEVEAHIEDGAAARAEEAAWNEAMEAEMEGEALQDLAAEEEAHADAA